nr:helix-turn-helix domain-containing protein [uncultured Cohaesibacter sp.]
MSDFGKDLIEAMQQAAAHAQGKDVPGTRVHYFPDPAKVREKIGLSQEKMAPLVGMSLSGYRKWEQGKRQVSGPAQTLLRVLDKNPKAVFDALEDVA